MKPTTKILLFISLALISVHFSASAQKAKWTQWEKLYADHQVTVEIKFKIRKNSCGQGGKKSKFKYRVKGTLYSQEKYVYWKTKYKGCNNIEITPVYQIAIGGSSAALGIVESMDFSFLCKKMIKLHYDASTKIKKKDLPKKKLDKKAYRYAKKKIRKEEPYKYAFKFGTGIYSNFGNPQTMNFNNLHLRVYEPYVNVGLFRKFGINEKFTRKKNRDISRASFIGLFADAGTFNVGTSRVFKNDFDINTETWVRLEGGFHFWEAIRLSGGVINYGIPKKVTSLKDFDNIWYSGTVGLTIKYRKSHFDLNYVRLTDQKFTQNVAYLQFGASLYINFIRTVPKRKKERLKKKFSY